LTAVGTMKMHVCIGYSKYLQTVVHQISNCSEVTSQDKVGRTHEDDRCPVALLEAKIIVHAGNACYRHIGAVNKSQGVEATEDGEEAKVNLSQQTLLEFGIMRGRDCGNTVLGVVKVFGKVVLGGGHAFAVIDALLVIHVRLDGGKVTVWVR
jgi:hypothetical protein